MARLGPRATRKRIEILKSAAAAFRRRGYHGSTVEEIASALEMTKGSLYYYFRNKEEILYFCHDYSLDILLGVLEQARQSGRSPDGQLRALLQAFVHTIIDELRGTALTLDFQALSASLLREIVAKRDRFERGIRNILQDGMDRGIFLQADPKLLTFAILGAVNWIPRWYDPSGPAGSQQIAEAFADYLVGGLTGNSAEPAAGWAAEEHTSG